MILPTEFDFTQGNLQDYLDCPYRFYMRYILRTKWPALVVGDALEFEARGQAGGRFHRLVQQYLLGVPQDRIDQMAVEDLNPDLSTWWDGFLAHVPPWLVGERWVETTLTTELASHRLVAKYDLILSDQDGGLTIFDWKTSHKLPRKDWLLERVQTRLYRLLLLEASPLLTGGERLAAEQIVMNYWFTAQPQSPVALAYQTSAYQRDRSDLSRLIEEISASKPSDFRRTNDIKKCHFCIYRSHCDRGIQAGDLGDYDDFDLEPGDVTAEIPFEDLPEIKF
ncbi:MAG: PD-(D/E)XK nuclease family protein [Brevefilum sp.]|nr:PD-(D/E)XK nuclease family protein [Brevefilum sp.]